MYGIPEFRLPKALVQEGDRFPPPGQNMTNMVIGRYCRLRTFLSRFRNLSGPGRTSELYGIPAEPTAYIPPRAPDQINLMKK